MEKNNLDALKARVEFKRIGLDNIKNGVGRADKIVFVMPGRDVTILIEQPEKYQKGIDALLACLAEDAAGIQKIVDDGEIVVRKAEEKRIAEEKKNNDILAKQQADMKLKQEEEKKAYEEAERLRKEQESKIQAAKVEQEEERAKQEKLRTALLQAEVNKK